jgi:hypothetical protein
MILRRGRERAAHHFAVSGMYREAYQSSSGGVVFQDEIIARPDNIKKFRGRNPPRSKINPSRTFDRPQGLIEQYGAGQHGKSRKVARERRVIRSDVKCVVHAYDSLTDSWPLANPCRAC